MGAVLFSLGYAGLAWATTMDTQWALDFWPVAFVTLAVIRVGERVADYFWERRLAKYKSVDNS